MCGAGVWVDCAHGTIPQDRRGRRREGRRRSRPQRRVVQARHGGLHAAGPGLDPGLLHHGHAVPDPGPAVLEPADRPRHRTHRLPHDDALALTPPHPHRNASARAGAFLHSGPPTGSRRHSAGLSTDPEGYPHSGDGYAHPLPGVIHSSIPTWGELHRCYSHPAETTKAPARGRGPCVPSRP
ncbi:hypothetical protein MICRO8M_60220 [Microbacterium sp. 8M]|nr:hypothetical protein MICRO8M_60220 [Microbacterium sp. 8M]